MKAVTLEGSIPTIYTTVYNQFKGVDFSTDPMLVDKTRSPFAVNLISDTGGMPEKRPGWRTLRQLEGHINGLWHCHIEDADHLLVHAGSKIYKWTETGEPTVLKEGVNDARSTAFFLLSKLYILTGAEYLQFDGETISEVEAYVPTVTINRTPTGGGDFLEAPNLIGGKWTEEFIGDGTSKTYKLSYEELDATKVECEIYDTASSKWVAKAEGTDFTVDRTEGKVTFNNAPADHTIPNVKITASREAKNKGKITGAKGATVYNNSAFLFGSERGVDYRSGYEKPGYFPDTGYDRVGTDETDIMGYCKIGEYLGIIKESNSQDSTIFLRWHEQQTNKDGVTETVYRKKQGVVGVGAISRHAIGMLLDEPLFLSEQGVFALTSNAVTFERTVQNRSSYLDFKLTKEPNLSEAVSTEWQGYFVVCVNGHAYVLDGRQPTQKSRVNSSFVYEGYYWENIPARVLLSVGDILYFGTEDGRICVFNSDKESMNCYNDDGQAIIAVWSTCADDDGYPTRLKTMVKNGCSVTLKPYNRSSVSICVRTEKDAMEREIRFDTVDKDMFFDFEVVDFSRINFDTNDGPRDVMIRKKVKKYKRLQFVVKNEAVNEGFGVYQIAKNYIVLGLAK